MNPATTPTDPTGGAARRDLVDAHRTIARRWATPGSFWTAEQRLAIVTEVRRARAAEPLPPWVAPSTVAGVIPPGHRLPDVAVDVIWRLTNHPGTLTADWYHGVVEAGLEPGAYVELVAVVAQANCVDRFADALDRPRVELPEPEAGAPRVRLGDDVAVRRHWVPTARMRGPNVLRALSMLPFENESRGILSAAHYLPPDALLGDLRAARGALSRPQIELVAARTSTLNECFY